MTDREVSGNHGIEHGNHQRIIDEANENPAEQTANILDACSAEYKAAMAKLSQAREKLYGSINELLLSASMVMLNHELTLDERINKAISRYEKANELASHLDDELRGKNKHLEVLNAYKEFLQKYELEGKDEKLKKVEARISELSQNDEEIYNQVDELLIKISTYMFIGYDRGTMTSYKELDDLLSKVDNTPEGKNKHLIALNSYKRFLEKCILKERDEELKRVEARISELRQDDEEKQDNEEIYKQFDKLLIKLATSQIYGDDRETMALYKKLDDLLSKVDNTPDGKDKHLKALEAYKEFLEKCKLKERDDELAKVEARISELRQDDEEKQNNEEIYKQVDQILIDITTFTMLNNDKLTMAAYKKLDNLLSKVDNTPDGKNKHLIALRYYKEFLEKCKLKERDEELMRVENLITKLSQE